MAVYRFYAEIGEDHRVDVPTEIPPGPADVTIHRSAEANYSPERFQAMVRKLAAGPHHTRTKEDIDAELRRERESWE